MPYSNSYNLFFIHIPKTAGTTIEKALDIQKFECLYSEIRESNKRTTPQHFSLKEIEKIMGDKLNDYDLFTIVRNPFDRIVSEYYHVKYNYLTTNYKDLCFDKFVENILNMDSEKRVWIFDGHMEPQSSFLNGVNNHLVKIFKYENLDEVFSWLKTKTGKPLDFGHERKSSRKYYKEYFTNQNTIQKVIEFYKKDFELFSYDTNIDHIISFDI